VIVATEGHGRFSDAELSALRGEVNKLSATVVDHVSIEDKEHRQQQEIYDALFRQEDKERGIPAGVIQMLARVDGRVTTMEIATDRQKRFIGGVFYGVTAIGLALGFFLSESAHKLFSLLKSL
jgi:hypothetical protein